MAILGIPGAVGFRSNTAAKIKKGLFDKLGQNKRQWEVLANKNAKLAFRLFSKAPVLTGATRKATSAKVTVGEKAVVIRFKTLNDSPSNDGQQRGYRIFPLLGLSTSKKYGKRNWLMKGAEKTIQDIKK